MVEVFKARQEQIINKLKHYLSLNPVSLNLVWLNLLTIVFGLLFSPRIFAIGFGDVLLRSSLGEPLNAQVPLSGASQDILTPSCIKAKIETIEGDFIANPRIELIYPKRVGNAPFKGVSTQLNFVTKELIIEPAVTLSISLTCGSFMQRTYSLLLDYPEISTSVAAQTSTAVSTSVSRIAKDENTGSTKPGATNTVTNQTKPTSTKKTPRAQPNNRLKKSAPVVKHKTKNAVKPVKPEAKLATPKDELKLTTPEINFETKAENKPNTSPTSAVNLAEQKPINIDQQRLFENSHAQERFAAMLRDEPSLLAAQVQAEKIKNEEKKVKKLEEEVALLKLQVQSNNKQDQHLPLLLIVVNVVALLLLLVVGKLWLSLRKLRQPQDNQWWDPSAGHKQKVEKIVDALQEHAEKGMLDPGIFAAVPENKTEEKIQPASPVNPPSSVLIKSDASNDIGNLPRLEDTNSSSFNVFATQRAQSIQIEELSDSTQEAEFWVSINDPNRAIEILEPQSLDENLSVPVTLLYLLDLYRMVGDEVKYNHLRTRFKRKFNTNIPQFNDVIDPDKVNYLEDYEHLISRCCSFWNTHHILPFLESLIIDDREGERVGFELPVYRDILLLISICKELERTKNVSAAST